MRNIATRAWETGSPFSSVILPAIVVCGISVKLMPVTFWPGSSLSKVGTPTEAL